MQFLCSTFGSSGDVFPAFGLALALRDRGHDVTFATNIHYQKLAERHDLPFEAIGTEEEFDNCINHPDLWHPRKSFKHLYNFLRNPIRKQYDIYCKHATKPDAIGITNCFGYGALLARDKTQLPVLTLHCQPAVIWSDVAPPSLPGMFGPRWLRKFLFKVGNKYIIDPVICPDLNAWRRDLGLPPVRNITSWWHSPDGVIAMFPDWYCPSQTDWPQNVMQTDFPLWNDPRIQSLPDEVTAFLEQGTAPVAFTPGSTNLHGQDFFATAIEACKILKQRAILLTEYPEQLPKDLPSHAIAVRYVPLELLLPHCSAFVHHGGVGSASQGMAAGIPQLIMTLAHDQFDNAQRLQDLQIGDSLLPKDFQPHAVAKKLGRLLTDSGVAVSCRDIANRMTSRDGLDRTVDAIQQWWQSRKNG
jgi:rhamnosyltransferase subunit B